MSVYESRINLGRGITNNQSLFLAVVAKASYFLEAIQEFGIEEEDLRRINPTYEDLLAIHSELMTFGFSTKYINMQTITHSP